MDEDLLDGRPALAAGLARAASRRASRASIAACFRSVAGRRGEAPAGPLELALERLEAVDDVARGPAPGARAGRA